MEASGGSGLTAVMLRDQLNNVMAFCDCTKKVAIQALTAKRGNQEDAVMALLSGEEFPEVAEVTAEVTEVITAAPLVSTSSVSQVQSPSGCFQVAADDGYNSADSTGCNVDVGDWRGAAEWLGFSDDSNQGGQEMQSSGPMQQGPGDNPELKQASIQVVVGWG